MNLTDSEYPLSSPAPGRQMVPRDVQTLILRTSESVLLHDNSDFAVAIQFMVLKIGR
jgi:hypothetical protein